MTCDPKELKIRFDADGNAFGGENLMQERIMKNLKVLVVDNIFDFKVFQSSDSSFILLHVLI